MYFSIHRRRLVANSYLNTSIFYPSVPLTTFCDVHLTAGNIFQFTLMLKMWELILSYVSYAQCSFHEYSIGIVWFLVALFTFFRQAAVRVDFLWWTLTDEKKPLWKPKGCVMWLWCGEHWKMTHDFVLCKNNIKSTMYRSPNWRTRKYGGLNRSMSIFDIGFCWIKTGCKCACVCALVESRFRFKTTDAHT